MIKLPFQIVNFLGVVFLNNFEKRPKLRQSLHECPFLCFRVVTRGLYPDLVQKNVQLNLQTCQNFGLKNFVIQVVSDKEINLSTNKECCELIVPVNYKTKHGTLFKARALQYALEPEIDILKPGDWIVHLDEETLMTEDSLIGIINFTVAKTHSFGQGVITYNNGEIVNWITTLADSVRVGTDYGYIRFCLRVLHRPLFFLKGSFLVANAEAEKKISFDHGPEASITEDSFFASLAHSQGFSFGFVEGTMLEQSTFTIHDFAKQRRRWMHGVFLTAVSSKIPVRYNFGPILISLSSCFVPLNTLLIILMHVLVAPLPHYLVVSSSFTLGTTIFFAIFGTFKTFEVHKHGLRKCILLISASVVCCFLSIVIEHWNSVAVFWQPRSTMNRFHFYIVKKEIALEDSTKRN
ncbi:beta-1 4-mannosyltransferase egh [Biomphalaria glabrata]|uniref:Beta-1,4-mannosyltransferase egh-like n=1 Tax=Biomphalaria glabrata TaxID=6526 RepID=A0A9W3B7C2_BIOGL|nr:beta-1,4-mannosyltransferase egh-like [Biomphalaria glabrata]KAI8757352.1 beta-1; 4-mannosyltransferase egh-like [Biomphalaria glabrata]